ncbi:glycosyltransferase family 87 protein [Falsihalocynthiibacter arcticus]|uniref:glycosyltransferase family 87 protein n=1 Tax=Falsihalocynthiibacter arcticus TaxID=1579316 RepID=UPI00146FF16A|nr:glycosyltransferase family 87 protein [Falsihalocynthiibacter arcticus]
MEIDPEITVFPFIYPPIWAALFSNIIHWVDLNTTLTALHILNPLMMIVMIIFAARTCKTTFSTPRFVAIGGVLIFGTTIGMLPLIFGQVQILVSMILLIAIERLRNGSQVTAGALFAFAAAIKVYPALFLIFLVVRRENRAVASFIIVGGGFGALSILIAGWPLHVLFLEQLNLISNSVLVNTINLSVDSLIANIFQFDALTDKVTSSSNGKEATLLISAVTMAKPAIWKALNSGAILLSLISLAYITCRYRDDVAIWPFALIVIALLSPIAWVHHFLPAAAFAPMLLSRFPTKVGLYLLGGIFAPLLLVLTPIYASWGDTIRYMQVAGFLSMSLLAAAYLYLILNSPQIDTSNR